MRHIKRIRIRGFQSHEDTTLELHPGLNAITGPSDNGKSAVLRALAWWAWNETPSGDWIRKGCTLASVEVELSDGTWVIRERRSGRNRYLIRLPGADEPLELADFGRNVPAEVLQAHGMIPVSFDPDRPSTLNLATQLEAPFFLTETAPMRARILGRLAGVHVIDHAIKEANRDLQAIARETKQQEAEVERLATQLTAYADLEAQEARVARAEALLAEVEPLEQRMRRLHEIHERFLGVQAGIASTGAILRTLQGVDAAAARLAEAQQAEQRRGRLQALAAQRQGNQVAMTQARATLERHARLPEAEKALVSARDTDARLATLQQVSKRLFDYVVAEVETGAILDRTQHVQEATEALSGAAGVTATLDRLTALQAAYQRLQTEHETMAQTLDRATRRLAAGDLLQQAAVTEERLTALVAKQSALRDLTRRLEEARQEAARLDYEVDATAAEYAEALQESGVCPTCLQTIDPTTAARIAATMKGECEHAA